MSTSKATMRVTPGNTHAQRTYGRAMLVAVVLVALGVLLVLAYAVVAMPVIGFDAPLLWRLRGWTSPGCDDFFLQVSKFGYQYGVIPLDAMIVLALLRLRRWRQAMFAGSGFIGSALLNIGIKHLLQRPRPQLWESIAPEYTFSFPSAHAMGSMTLALVLIAFAWNTRWRWSLLTSMGLFALLVGISRVYLGVHYPSDVVAGWCAAIVWVGTLYLLMFRTTVRGRLPRR